MALTCATCRPSPQVAARSTPTPTQERTAAADADARTSTPGILKTPTAKELGELLPNWTRGYDRGYPQEWGPPPGAAEYRRLKAAALALARAPEQERRNVISAYGWAYCEMPAADAGRTSGMFLLLRVLFVVPEGDPAWGPHAEADGRILRVGPCCANRTFQSGYFPLWEYDNFAKRFPRRSPAEIEVLEIR